MTLECTCTERKCICVVEVYLSEDEQNDIILARIMGEAVDTDMLSYKPCQLCSDGWHVFEAGGPRIQVKTEEKDETDKS